jgi:outer membrane biosynthesis protein TonB
MGNHVVSRPRRVGDSLPSEIAVLISVLAHGLAILSWEHRAVWRQVPLLRPLIARLAPARPAPPPVPVAPTITFVPTPSASEPQPPRRFMETDDTQVTGEEPKQAEFYSDRSTVAANPENPTGKIGDTPYLAGTDTRMLSTESVVPTPAIPARPAPPAPPPPPPRPAPTPQPATPEPVPPPKPVAETGVRVIEEPKLALLEKPLPAAPLPPPPAAPPAAPALPALPGSRREIAAVKSRLTAAGAGRIGIAAFNVAGSPFGEYDKALIRAVQSRWYALIEQNGLYERAGQVTLRFLLMADGSVQDLAVKENTAGQILGLFCEKAVVDSAPFAPLPETLRSLIGEDAREVNFTFYY